MGILSPEDLRTVVMSWTKEIPALASQLSLLEGTGDSRSETPNKSTSGCRMNRLEGSRLLLLNQEPSRMNDKLWDKPNERRRGDQNGKEEWERDNQHEVTRVGLVAPSVTCDR